MEAVALCMEHAVSIVHGACSKHLAWSMRRQLTVKSEHRASGSRQRAVGSGQQAAGSQQRVAGRRQRAAGRQQWAAGSRQRAANSGLHTRIFVKRASLLAICYFLLAHKHWVCMHVDGFKFRADPSTRQPCRGNSEQIHRHANPVEGMVEACSMLIL
eukprot:366049-Chlamydomonas_euryale.AAC.7